MLLKTILNRVEQHKGFVYGKVRWLNRGKPSIEVEVRPGPTYDRLKRRLIEFVPLWQIIVFFAYAPRRVDCKRCGVTVEMLPWATAPLAVHSTDRKSTRLNSSHRTISYAVFCLKKKKKNKKKQIQQSTV